VKSALKKVAMSLVGLAFSGGGIRSATFNLGLLQGLVELSPLPMFDYISTGSGGGSSRSSRVTGALGITSWKGHLSPCETMIKRSLVRPHK
jgi:hypothetical protein